MAGRHIVTVDRTNSVVKAVTPPCSVKAELLCAARAGNANWRAPADHPLSRVLLRKPLWQSSPAGLDLAQRKRAPAVSLGRPPR